MFWIRLARPPPPESASASLGSAATAARRASISAWERVSLPLILERYRLVAPIPEQGSYHLKRGRALQTGQTGTGPGKPTSRRPVERAMVRTSLRRRNVGTGPPRGFALLAGLR